MFVDGRQMQGRCQKPSRFSLMSESHRFYLPGQIYTELEFAPILNCRLHSQHVVHFTTTKYTFNHIASLV